MKIDFTIEQIQVLDHALQQLPFYLAAPLIAHINKELAEQQKIMDEPIDEAQIAIVPSTPDHDAIVGAPTVDVTRGD